MLAPLRSAQHTLPSPPAQLSPLIGRAQEVAAVCTLLRRPDVRLLTLTGTGGIGKTRLGHQVAAELLGDFADGVCFVSLASIRGPELVIPTQQRYVGSAAFRSTYAPHSLPLPKRLALEKQMTGHCWNACTPISPRSTCCCYSITLSR